ncbi:MAG: TIGR00282 family metallophosphoesterase [Clostridia bacterium]|nr:TIGR00282 family metallophosphoesterase [Clostridia bacterium]
MSVLCIGDVIGTVGMKYLHKRLPTLKSLKKIDAVIVNGENSADTNGITPDSANYLLNCGVDLITTGNHSFQRKESYPLYENRNLPVIRPANYPSKAPGTGSAVIDIGRAQIRVLNMMGTVEMNPVLDCPFATSDALLEGIEEKIVIMDFHAEATGEKRALACYLDGRISAMFGTHTHVQTADEQILPGGTGFITDVGMTGPVNSVIGVSIDAAIEKMKTKMPVRLSYADGECMLNAVLFTIDEKSGRTTAVERINIAN